MLMHKWSELSVSSCYLRKEKEGTYGAGREMWWFIIIYIREKDLREGKTLLPISRMPKSSPIHSLSFVSRHTP